MNIHYTLFFILGCIFMAYVFSLLKTFTKENQQVKSNAYHDGWTDCCKEWEEWVKRHNLERYIDRE